MRRLVVAAAVSSAVLSALAPALYGQGWIIPRPCGIGVMPVPGPISPVQRNCVSSITRSRSDVRVELADRVLRYEVDERFVNRGGAVGEADYIFPLPNGAAFQDLELSINGELVSGETMNAADARRIYENIVRAQKDPALVEWMGRGLVRARIFPINPGEEKRVVVRFQSVAAREGDAFRVDYVRGGSVTQSSAGGASSFTLSYRATPDLGNPYSPTHQVDVNDRDGRRVVEVRGDARDVTLLVPARKAASASIAMLPYAPGNEDGFALITVTPPAARREDATPRDVTLVLDVSGSMSGRKIQQARAAGHQLLGTLHPGDRFRLIDFSSEVRTFRDDFVDASNDNVSAADRYLDALEAVGGTNIEGALREALRAPTPSGRLPLILFLTDGEPTVGETSPDRLATIATDANRDRGTTRRIFTFGLGSDVNVSLLEQLALEGRGTSQFVRPHESVERMVGVVADRLTDPVLTDVRVRVEGNVRLTRALPSDAADVFADRDLVLLGRYSGHGAARVVVDGSRHGVPTHWESTVDFPDRERDNPFVARLWATQRVGYLSAEKRKRGGSSEIDDEIKMLGERYGIPTEFTSYLVVEPRMTAASGVRRDASMGVRLDQVVTTGVAASAPAPSVRERAFESAKAASVQRAALNLAAADSIAESGSVVTRRVGARTFVNRDGVWTDTRLRDGMETTTIKPYSQAYFDLLNALPELRDAFALGARVKIAGKARAIVVAENGAAELSASTLSAIIKAW